MRRRRAGSGAGRARRARVEALEPRILLSADFPGLEALLAPEETAPLELRMPETDASPQLEQSVRRELVFIDPRVENADALIADLTSRNDRERRIEVVTLDAARDGVAQIRDVLARSEEPVDAVHVVSHGTDSGFQLGATWLTRDNVADHADSLARWNETLAEDADLLLYGCNLASAPDGQALVGSLARLTGADVAASTDLTGSARQGGDWELEYTEGRVESTVAFSAQARTSWAGLLDGTAIWAQNGQTTPLTSAFDGTSFGPTGPTVDVGHEWNVIAGAESPDRDEAIVAGIGDDGNLVGMVWDGTAWTTSDPLGIGVPNITETERWAIDVTYESASGDAILVWSSGSTQILGQEIWYATWNGTNWSLPKGLNAPAGVEINQIRLASNPNSDEVVLVASNEDYEDYAFVWDGSNWGNAITLHDGNNVPDNQDVQIVYEQQSGHAMAVWAENNPNLRYRIWDGASWSAEQNLTKPGGVNGKVISIAVAADPTSDRIVLGAVTEDNETWLAAWDGGSWDPSVLATSDSPHTDRLGVAVAFESTSGEALAAYATTADEVRFRTWSTGGGWSGESVGPDIGAQPNVLTLDADPESDSIMLSVVADDRDIWFAHWDGGSFVSATELETDATTNAGQPFLFLWDAGETAPNTAPVLTPGGAALTGIDEDDLANGGDLVSAIVGAAIADPDGGAAEGIAIFGLASGNGTWEYSTTGGVSWNAVGAVDPTNALVLRSTDRVRFVPDGENGTSPSFDFRAWDQTDGSSAGDKVDVTTNGGTSAFSAASDTATIAVASVNDAPVLAPASPALAGIAEDDLNNAGDLVSDLLGGTLSDVDAVTLQGIAITAVASGNGTWQFSTNGGGAWSNVGAVDASNALLLRSTDRVRFVPDGQNADTASFDFLGWDQTSGAFGTKADASTTGGTTAFSDDANTATVTVTATNDAPVLAAATPSLTTIDEDETGNPGDLVSDILGGSVTDGDAGALQGIAITALASGRGTWQYDTGGGFTDIGAVNATNALLLRATDRIRFVPDAENADTASFDFRAWDQTSGAAGTKVDASTTGGTTAFSDGENTAGITVTAVNDAPTLASGVRATLNAVSEDAGAPVGAVGTLVTSLVDVAGGGGLDNYADVDATTAVGIAITNSKFADGTWYFTTDGGASWNLLGTPNNNNARLLSADALTRVYFQPNPDFEGTIENAIRFRAWDGSTGVAGGIADSTPAGGTTAFSSVKNGADLTVTAVNDAPVLDASGNMVLADVAQDDADPPGTSVLGIIASAGGDRITDADAGASEGIAVTGVDDTNGTWHYSTNGGGAWISFAAQGVSDGGTDDANAVLLDTTVLVRFVPDAAYVGTAGTITFRAWDQTSGANGDVGVDVSTNGGTTAFSTATETATLGVNAPVGVDNIVPGPQNVDEDGTLVFSVANGNSITVSGGGAGDATLRVVVSVTNGAFTLAGTVGLASVSGNGTASVTMTGSSAAIDAALAGASYQPTGDYAGAANVQIETTLASLEGHYTFDDTGDLGNDESPAGTNDGTVTGAVAGVDAGARDSILTFDGNDRVDITGRFGDPANVTLATWVNLDAGFQTDDVINLGGGVVLTVDETGNGVTGHFWDGAAEQLTTSGTFIAGTGWHHVAYTFDDGANEQILYIDGVAVNTTNHAASISYGLDPDSYLGHDPLNAANALHGSLDDARVYDRALTATEVAALAADSARSSDAIAVTVDAVNDAPAGTAGSVATNEDTPYVFEAVDFGFTDPVEGHAFAGIVVTTAPGAGTLRNGGDVLTGGEFVTAAEIAAGDLVFTPADDAHGLAYTSFTFQVRDDGGTANGGVDTDPVADTMTIDVTPVNDAPEGTNATVATPEDTVFTFATGHFGFSDPVEGHAFDGIIVTTVPGDGTLRNGGTVLTGGEFVSAAAIAANALTFTPAPEESGAAYASFTFQVQDAGGTTNGGVALDPTANTITIDVTSANDAPVLTPGGSALTGITEDQQNNAGDTVADIAGGAITDADAGAVEGIAITSLVSGTGTWQFSLNGGVDWNAIPAVSNANALLLRATDRVRFVPDGQNATNPSFTFRAWDQTSGLAGNQVDAGAGGGASAFSAATDVATIAVTDVNDAPTLAPGAPSLGVMTEDAGATPGTLVGTVLGASMSDIDAVAPEGIAVTALSGANGTWEFSTNGGASWNAIGSVAANNALLLRDTDRIRFRPNGTNGTAATLGYHAWDQSTGAAGIKTNASVRGGTTAYSTAGDTLQLTVSSVNDAPSIGGATLASVPGGTADPPGASVAGLFGPTHADVDAGASFAGIAVVGNGANAGTEGTWQYSTDSGANWFDVGTVADGATALALPSTSLLRFVPAAGFEGEPASLSVRSLDDTFAGAFSSTAGGTESRQFADTTGAGGTSAISGNVGSLATMIGEAEPPPEPPPAPPPDLEPPEPGEDPEPEEEPEPEPEETPEPETPEPGDSGALPGDGIMPPPLDSEEDAPPAPELAPPAPVYSIDTDLDEGGTDGDPGTRPGDDSFRRGPREAAGDRVEFRQLTIETVRNLLNGGFDFLSEGAGLLEELDRFKEEAEVKTLIENAVAGSSAAVSAGLSLGYVVWLTRGGLLLASFASSMPAWRLVDPIPILASLAVQQEGEDESLESLVDASAEEDSDGEAGRPKSQGEVH